MDGSKIVVVVLVQLFSQSSRFVIAVAKHGCWFKASPAAGVMCSACAPRGLFEKSVRA